MFVKSICEYQDRLHYGNNRYRGNTSGGLISDFLDFAHRDKNGLFVDPMQGGATSKDVAIEKGLRYVGLDLKTGFNLTKDDLGKRLGERAESIFCHPPYWQMIQYSNHPDDLSNGTLDEFLQKLQLAMMNVYDALRPGGMYGVLMGNYRTQGNYYPLCALTLSVCPGKLREEIIKLQNNCLSDQKHYPGAGKTFMPIKHEILYIFQKEWTAQVLFDFACDFSNHLARLQQATWVNIVKRIFQREQKELSLEQLYQCVQDGAKERVKKNPHWKAKIRQIVGQNPQIFQRISKGCYVLQ